MTLIYSRDDATLIVDPDTGTEYTSDLTGAFDVPQYLADKLIRQHVAGERVWETSPERQDREAAELDARRRDPLTFLDAVEKLQVQAPVPPALSEQERKIRAAALRAEADRLDPPRRRSRKPKAETA